MMSASGNRERLHVGLPLRPHRRPARRQLRPISRHLALGGAIIGYATLIELSPCLYCVHIIMCYGPTTGAFLVTEPASSLGLYLSKSITFERFGALSPDIALIDLI